jgi:hypothetical protein
MRCSRARVPRRALSGVSGLARGAAIALAMASSIAGLDELRQTHDATRTGAASDVVLDAAGASAALAALAAAPRARPRERCRGRVGARRPAPSEDPMTQRYDDVVRNLTAPGAPFEVVTETVRGRR